MFRGANGVLDCDRMTETQYRAIICDEMKIHGMSRNIILTEIFSFFLFILVPLAPWSRFNLTTE
jgi:hypothetical protein